ncbi:nitroreductase family deazaflavin-dependent oxidoreductase [Nocardia sp. CDC159]|uniref:Nitroreductase family deazaflavin-dependent oxidoreductase n=1 Tax=Nocardia pulmonis TaxID=2951408 RepID=A0A9X2EAQ8_9NOCA|nr:MULTISPECIES: nitroreductase/quinone reductase family protein [Nocardia]MCM6776796.1 nitroreductase family deazaflavin-dependent oxidoreductase [Nocardia pulmonis]MCM6789055.1 nitroreductase family deazaflavin-dependent oxidoreductase [Nocardia sp. CDC159]
MTSTKQRRVNWYHRHIANPLLRRVVGHVPGQALLETTGRRTGLPRRTPIGGRVIDGSFWLVSDHGRASAYVRNIEADPRVRLQLRSRWYTGTAHLLPDDDTRARLRRLPRLNSWIVRLLGTDLLTIRIDLD